MGAALSQASSRISQTWTASFLSASGLPLQCWHLLGVALPQTDLASPQLPLLPRRALCDAFQDLIEGSYKSEKEAKAAKATSLCAPPSIHPPLPTASIYS